MCVRNICVYGDRLLEENTSQRPLGEKLCQEFISGVLQRIVAAAPPAGRHDVERLSGRINWPLRACTKTIQRPSGETFGKLLLMPFRDAPAIGSGRAALAPVERNPVEVVLDLRLVADRWRTAPACVPADTRPWLPPARNTRYLPSGLQTALVCT